MRECDVLRRDKARVQGAECEGLLSEVKGVWLVWIARDSDKQRLETHDESMDES